MHGKGWAMGFESTLARRIHEGKRSGKTWKAYGSVVGAVLVVLTLAASTQAAPKAVIQLGGGSSVAKYLGPFDGHENVLMLGATTSDDWVLVKLPFKGRLSGLVSISFSEFIVQTGGLEVEPYIVLKLTEGRYLICHPESSYSLNGWSLPYFSWQMRDAASHGRWQIAPVDTRSMLAPLDSWVWLIGDVEVLSITVAIGGWDIENPYQCYIGDLTVNGKKIDLANAGRTLSPNGGSPYF